MKKILYSGLVAGLFLSSCTTQKLANQASGDDVYSTGTEALAVERPKEKTYRTDEQLYGGSNRRHDAYDYNDYDFDYGYASRLNRFYYGSYWRPYYDSWYTYSYDPWYSYRYDPFYFNDPWGYRSGLSMSFGWGMRPYWGYNPWMMYGYGYRSNYWGPLSYYGYPGYGYGYYPGQVVVRDRNYRPRPSLGSGNPAVRERTDRNAYPGGTYDRSERPGRISRPGSVAERPQRPERVERPDRTERPQRPERTERPERMERPERTERPTYDRPTRMERPERMSSPDRGSYSPSSGGGYSRGGDRSERPTRSR